MRGVALFGVPGVGKSFLVRMLLCRWPHLGNMKSGKLKAQVHQAGSSQVAVLGNYEESLTFPGTDTLPMDVARSAEKFALNTKRDFLWEGDRLLYKKFVNVCLAHHEMRFYHVTVPVPILEARRQQRGGAQDPKWLKGRHTKVENMRHHLGRNCQELVLDNAKATIAAIDKIAEHLEA